jgi:3-phosphoshikimate 1-carboxyvinyltransferase
MAIAIASIRAQGEITLEDADAINKSYPQFYEEFQSIGGIIHDN